MHTKFFLSALIVHTCTLPAFPDAVSFPTGLVPFSSIYYIAGPDAGGDRLVEGLVTFASFDGIQSISPGTGTQQFADASIELAPGRYFSNVFVPTASELSGNFHALSLIVYDPVTGIPGVASTYFPFAGNYIPTSRLQGLFAFEVGPALAPAPEPSVVALLLFASVVASGVSLARKVADRLRCIVS